MPRSRKTDRSKAHTAPGRRLLTGLASGVVLLLIVATVVASFLRRSEPARPPEPVVAESVIPSPLPPTFVGHERCADCHRAETEAWRTSQHARAMQPATSQTVLGRFDGARFTYNGVTSTFFRKADRYFVRTDGPDGRL